MSRRKQARPIRVLDSEEGLTTAEVPNGDSTTSGSEDDAGSCSGQAEAVRRLEDELSCENCSAEFHSMQEALLHKKECNRRKELLGSPQSLDNEDMVVSGEEDEEDESIPEEGCKRQEEERRQRQDAENNNSVEDAETEGEGELQESEIPLGFPFQLPAAAAAGHVTLEALQNTKVAVAQFAATAMANNADNAAALQELAVLQSTLYTLQHQQMMQLNLIQQLQQQLQITRPKEGSPTSPSPPQTAPLPLTLSVPISVQSSPQTPIPPPPPPPPPPKPSRTPTPVKQEVPLTPPTTQSVPASHAQSQTPTSAPKPQPSPPPVQTASLPPCSISSSFASSIITNLDPPSPNEPNTLEMLQRRAQEVLDNASQGLLANNLADELAFRKNGGKGNSLSPYDSKSGGRNEPFFKHRCRYCGKVFGSDSALQIHIRSHTVRGNTTCNICFKTFACNSALEIHYRSHTKERPFKCTICDRGFSTKGNMKQHMLTHKIRDMPSHLFEQKPMTQDDSSNTNESRDTPALTPTTQPLPQQPQPPPQQQPQQLLPRVLSADPPQQPLPPPIKEQPPIKRSSPPEGEAVLPVPKRQPSLPKHLCHVCNKNFSSSSALQIHMRTHTGDKPFRCTICHKAFTTKGNLKVHMGTHMWTNGASRRGRRMSLDLPPLPITPKDSDFLHRRPDLFYPYLPAPFLNGMQQKLNEISVIQNVGNNMNNGLLGFGGYGGGIPGDMKPGSPMSDKPLSPPGHRRTPPLWDLHYERKPQQTSSEEQMEVCTSPSTPSHVAPPRGEGLAA